MMKKNIGILIVISLFGILLLPQPARAAVYDCYAQIAIPTSECEALVDIYNATDGNHWTDNTGWLNSTDPCGWYGVGCAGPSPTYVLSLDLSGNFLTGTIPASIGNLDQVFFLAFSTNNLSGGIPAQMADMSGLMHVYLHNNYLTGGIPLELGTMSNLSTLSLSRNQLEGTIPTQLGNISGLTFLAVDENNLSGPIPSSLGNPSNLQQLYLNKNQLTGGIPTSFSGLSALYSLSLGDNQLTGGLPEELTGLSNLEYLSVKNNPLTGVVPQSITNLTLLEGLYLNGTNLCEPDNTVYKTWTDGLSNYLGNAFCQMEMFYSQAAYDGWVLESAETSNTGGFTNTNWLTCLLGDDALNRQYRSIFHFNTSRLPDSAVITQVSLQYKQHSIIGSDPYVDHGVVWADIRNGFYSGSPVLQLKDFAAISSKNFTGQFAEVVMPYAYPVYRTQLKTDALQHLNLDGITQFRLRFAIDDDNDNAADYIKIFCGDMGVPFNRPVLRVWYYVP